MTGAGESAHDNVIDRSGEHLRDTRAQRLRVLRVRVDETQFRPERTSATAMAGPMGACLKYGKLVAGRKLLCRFRKPGGHVAVGLLARFRRSSFPVRIFFQELRTGAHFRAALSSLSISCPEATCCAALMASHSVGATTATRLPLTTTCAFGKRALSRVPAEMSFDPRRLGMHHRAHAACRARRTSVTHVSFAVTFETVTELGKDLPTTVYWLTGFSGGSPSTVNPNMLLHVTLDRNGQIQLLILDQVAIGKAFAAAGDDAVFHGKLILRDAEPLGSQIEQRLMNVGSGFADIRHSAAEEIESAAAVGRAISVARDHGSDRLRTAH